jgi:hypothetical protein
MDRQFAFFFLDFMDAPGIPSRLVAHPALGVACDIRVGLPAGAGEEISRVGEVKKGDGELAVGGRGHVGEVVVVRIVGRKLYSVST